MSRIGFVSVLIAYAWISGACSTQEIGFERDGQDHTVERDGRDYIEDDRQRFEVNPGGILTVDAELGTIRIRSSNNDEVDVLVRKRLRTTDVDEARKAFRNVEIVFNQMDTGVRIEVEQIDDYASLGFWQDRVFRWFRQGSIRQDGVRVEIDVMVPLEFNLDLITVIDDIQTGKIVGSVTAKTLTGYISTESTEGVLSTRTNSGNIETGRTVGDLHAKSLTGNIRIGPVDGDATIGTNSGRIETGTVQRDLHAKSLTGNIRIGPVDGDATIRTNSGDIQIGYVQGKLKSTTLSGNIKSKVPYTR